MTRVLREVRRFAAARPGPGVVAVSGGADSVALLRALHACGSPLFVAHVNHRLRGADSDADEAFVRALCAALGVACRVKSVDVAALAAGDNLESTARRVRYAFFAEVAAEAGAAWIATAHTADDQAETVLHRLIRGTGLQGLRGIASWRAGGVSPPSSHKPSPDNAPPSPPSSDEGSGSLGGLMPPARRGIVRPLLAVTRADVLAHLAALNQPHREDASNADTRFTRNRIRHELLPLLKTFNPDVVSALAHLAEHAAEAHEVITTAATELLTNAERPRAGATIVLDAGTLTAAPRAVVRATLRVLWDREDWPVANMTFDAWDRAVEIAAHNASACDFPGGVGVRRVGRVVQLTRRV
ncbi:tRNA lysidine(34) synthetase TilS [Frigoriglobus tundricola]|uniref:tRNA(Ile)-lysidine synthase n=1 Tax=Frigoriglobus tundricola TaxID=2774151 RepID=A0A6M5YXF1_9BACT|nr:tRNA lysidine(34) synthetase TilS [Frigoriglobus tundricola]QJW97961.1 tRNA(Ile)-lysidine synthetase [Frigoriglobus tundricola]